MNLAHHPGPASRQQADEADEHHSDADRLHSEVFPSAPSIESFIESVSRLTESEINHHSLADASQHEIQAHENELQELT